MFVIHNYWTWFLCHNSSRSALLPAVWRVPFPGSSILCCGQGAPCAIHVAIEICWWSATTLHLAALVVMERVLAFPNYGGDAQNSCLFRWMMVPAISPRFYCSMLGVWTWLSTMMHSGLWLCSLWWKYLYFPLTVKVNMETLLPLWLMQDDARWYRGVSSGLWHCSLMIGKTLLSSNCIGEAQNPCCPRWLMLLPMIDDACDSSHYYCSTFVLRTFLSTMT